MRRRAFMAGWAALACGAEEPDVYRIPGYRFNRGRVAPRLGAAPAIWEQIPGAFAAWRSDLGVTQSGTVSSWASQVAGGGNLVQATAAQQPGYSASDANWGGLPSITFGAASDDNLDSDLAASSWNFLHDGTGATILVVFRAITGGTGTQQRIFNTSGGAASRGVRLIYNTTNTRFEFIVSDGASDIITVSPTAATAPLDTKFAVLCTHRTATTPDVTLYYPVGTSRGTGSGTPSASDAANTLSIGTTPGATTQDFTGEILEIGVWPREHTADERALVAAYTLGRYGV